jgi:hypothetical protein
MARIWLVASVMLLAGVPEAAAWGAAGHSIVAELAERRLSSKALGEITALLGGRKSLASISSWADEIQALRSGTRNWHFVNIPFDAEGYDAGRDCAPKPGGDCIVPAVERSRAVLADKSKPRLERAEALMLLVHLIGDVHQPLHCADRGDAGGSKLPVTFFGEATTLHMVWDVGIIERHTYSWGEYVRYLEGTWLPANNVDKLLGGDVVDWVNDAHRAAVSVAYVLPPDRALGDDYVTSARPVVDRQLALAGLRLARVLDEALGKGPSKKADHRRRRW